MQKILFIAQLLIDRVKNLLHLKGVFSHCFCANIFLIFKSVFGNPTLLKIRLALQLHTIKN